MIIDAHTHIYPDAVAKAISTILKNARAWWMPIPTGLMIICWLLWIMPVLTFQ